MNHAGLIVGYGAENGLEYFLMKNSWGESWGDKGFVKIGFQSGEGVCGIQVAPIQAELNGISQGPTSTTTKPISTQQPISA